MKTVIDPNGNKHKIYIDPDLNWLSPYLGVAKRLGVPVWRIKAIRGYHVPDGRQERQCAATIKEGGNSKATITILKWHQRWRTRKDGKFEVSHWISASSENLFEDTLEAFAHELSHLMHWQHTADRYIAEKRVQLAFAQLAKKRGYKGYDND